MKKLDDPQARLKEAKEAIYGANSCARCEARDRDWWQPDPEDPFWMLEAEDGEWLKNKHSFLGTRDASKALRFPTQADAENAKRSDWPVRWWSAKATEHSWIVL